MHNKNVPGVVIHQNKPEAKPDSADALGKMWQVDALMRSVYGRTLQGVIDDTFRRGYTKGIDDGWKEWYKQGVKSGRRLAKGKSGFPKSRGAPKVLGHDLLVLQFVDFVNRVMSTEEISLSAAVSKYRADFGRAWRDIAALPSQESLLRLYKQKTKPSAIDDVWRRIYNNQKKYELPDT